MSTVTLFRLKSKLTITSLLLAAAVVAAASMHTWTFKQSGKTLLGEVVGFRGDVVTLKLGNGKTVLVRAAYLADSDQAYLEKERTNQWKRNGPHNSDQ